MIVGLGIDVVEVARMAVAAERGGGRLLERVFTSGEIEAVRGHRRAEGLAARFAAKEAALKALGTGWSGGIAWKDVEVVRAEGGSVSLRITGRAAEVARSLGVARSHVSLSHHGGIAAAVVVLEDGR